MNELLTTKTIYEYGICYYSTTYFLRAVARLIDESRRAARQHATHTYTYTWWYLPRRGAIYSITEKRRRTNNINIEHVIDEKRFTRNVPAISTTYYSRTVTHFLRAAWQHTIYTYTTWYSIKDAPRSETICVYCQHGITSHVKINSRVRLFDDSFNSTFTLYTVYLCKSSWTRIKTL